MLDFVVANLPIVICVLAGLALVVLEVFLPGFGIPGISGIVLLLLAIGMVVFEYGMMAGLGLLIVVIAVLAVVISLSLKSASRGALSKSSLVLKDTVSPNDAQPEDMQVFVGHTGKALTVLRPTGIAEFDGVRLDVVTEGGFIEKDETVTITHVAGSRIVVRKGVNHLY